MRFWMTLTLAATLLAAGVLVSIGGNDNHRGAAPEIRLPAAPV
jgi:hypothetical protein